MSLTVDWDTSTKVSNATVSIAHTTSSPLDGNRSLRINVTTSGTSGTYGAGAVMLKTTNHSRGFVMGKIRTLIKVNGDDPTYAGIFCLASVDTTIADVGNAYVFGPTGSNRTLHLQKLTGGLSDSAPTLLYDTGINLTTNVTYAIQLDWKADLAIFGGVQFTMYSGTEVNFSDLGQIAQYTDETAPYLTSLSEGLFSYLNASVQNADVIFDDTTVIRTT